MAIKLVLPTVARSRGSSERGRGGESVGRLDLGDRRSAAARLATASCLGRFGQLRRSRLALLSAQGKEVGATLEMLVARAEQVSRDRYYFLSGA
jgi:hypothetical protein